MSDRDGVRLWLGDCLERMAEIEDGTVDAIISDPPYPCIDRPYGRMTEADWHKMMRGVVTHARRILKSSGSAVFILQPNSRKLGSMRPWLWEFMAWTAREWNQVQDFWWWNYNAIPSAQAIQGRLGRASLKACVWLGPPNCYRDQDAVLWRESDRTFANRLQGRVRNFKSPSGHHANGTTVYAAIERRGGVTPFNVIPLPNGNSTTSGGIYGHGAATPELLCDWWVRYLTPSNGVVLDPFMGSGTVGLAAIKRGHSFMGIERDPAYFAIAEARLAAHRASTPLLNAITP